MIKKLATISLVVGALILPIASYSADSDSDRSSPKAFVKDSVITTKIKTELAEENCVMVHIRVDTDKKGKVSLSGNARTQDDVDKAVSIARGVEGVTSVRNRIKVKADL